MGVLGAAARPPLVRRAGARGVAKPRASLVGAAGAAWIASQGSLGGRRRAAAARSAAAGVPEPAPAAAAAAAGAAGAEEAAPEPALTPAPAANPGKAEEAVSPWRRLALGAGLMFAVPMCIAAAFRFALFEPMANAWLRHRTASGAPVVGLSEMQYERLGEHLEQAERRLKFNGLTGRGPAYSEHELHEKLKHEAKHLEEHELQLARQGACNAMADAAMMVTVVLLLVTQRERAKKVYHTLGNEFVRLSSAQQAFTLLLIADTLVGYHSAEGWAALLQMLASHWGIVAEVEQQIRVFVAIVPVTMDVAFKYWVFRYLRKLSPSTQILLDDVSRH